MENEERGDENGEGKTIVEAATPALTGEENGARTDNDRG
jgi:hypothetical protein